MKNKILKTLIFGLGCLMLTLTISIGALNNNVKSINSHAYHIDIDMPLGVTLKFMQDMPLALVSHVIKPME